MRQVSLVIGKYRLLEECANISVASNFRQEVVALLKKALNSQEKLPSKFAKLEAANSPRGCCSVD